MTKVFQVNGTTVRIIGLDQPKRKLKLDKYQWDAYKARAFGAWPGEASEKAVRK